VGYFRKVAEDVELEACKKLGVRIVRRTSGGGSIFTDRNQLIFSLITDHALGSDVGDSFKRTCDGLITALEVCNIHATFKPPNDILINGKKISGSAQARKKRAYLTHSTIILDIDHDIIHSVLKQAKHGYTSSVHAECGFTPELGMLKKAIITAYSEQFGIQFQAGELTLKEQKMVQELIETKYGTDQWNFRR
jgi:lipoate-protein ligase A